MKTKGYLPVVRTPSAPLGTGGSPQVSEADLATLVEDCLERFDWLWCHSRPARIMVKGQETYRTAITGHKGITDYIAVRPPRLLFIELKSEKGKLSPGQIEWISALEQCQKSVLLEPLKLRQGKASVAIKEGQRKLTIPEVYCFRPSDAEPDGGEIVEILR